MTLNYVFIYLTKIENNLRGKMSDEWEAILKNCEFCRHFAESKFFSTVRVFFPYFFLINLFHFFKDKTLNV